MYKGIAILCLLLVAGCSSETTDPSYKKKGNLKDETSLAPQTIATDLQTPWDIEKTEHSFYVSERRGKIIQINNHGKDYQMDVNLQKEVYEYGEGGLLGFQLDDEFEKNSFAYIFHTYEEEGNVLNRIVQIKKSGNRWVEEKELLAHIPGGRIHNGGRLAIGSDQLLYATTGDTGNETSAQDLRSLSGKILRMHVDGSIPENNPFKDSFIYSYGHRNPQGLTWDEEGNLYSAEHGSSAHDEINVINAGSNYGWPIIQGDERKEGMEAPLFHSGNDTWAPSGIVFHDGKLIVAALRGERMLSFNLLNQSSRVIVENSGRIRDLSVDGESVYFITNNTDGRGQIRKGDDKLIKIPLK
ncbi:glucose/arabinose dehydrogenase [Bacillus ectoiniformans]|uniref:PQQ-dependent sugar dehydrogenase n=1 Tax=Bacillus ectoiniformans TaxID=1494429 RepID=UPI00195C6309|nr:PQQ-dependent sugar dehydrogenase [Bacillus ectoiniformans]MBM7647774.1 glucose/arabinose dehydrogenase [Bacillus ectoiniformans]